MKLPQLLGPRGAADAVADVEVSGLQHDSRLVRPGDVFFAFPGARVDGHEYVSQALRAGAVAVVSEREKPGEHAGAWIRVPHGREALAVAALNFYERPDRRLKLIGVTGTNGKTTTTFLIDAILEAAGRATARLGTVGYKIGGRLLPAINTTPESLDAVRHLVELERQGGTHAVLEVSSHALELRRIFGMDFHTAVFTNLSRDHLDFHETMEQYARAKRRLFEGAGGAIPRFGVINADDPTGREFLKLPGFEALSYGRRKDAAVTAKKIEVDLMGCRMTVTTPRGKLDLRSGLRGAFNVSNILAAVAAGLAAEIDLQVIRDGIERCPSVPGRFEPVHEGQDFLVIVDYAHTDDALKNLIESARGLLARQEKRGRVITVFGCGGDRDRTKRPAMGEIAARLSDQVILTSDNPRTEDPLLIINDVRVGLQRVGVDYDVEADRGLAIRKAIGQARSGDIVLLAGKGHETYQIIGRDSLPFDDRQVAREVLREKGYGSRPPSRSYLREGEAAS